MKFRLGLGPYKPLTSVFKPSHYDFTMSLIMNTECNEYNEIGQMQQARQDTCMGGSSASFFE